MELSIIEIEKTVEKKLNAIGNKYGLSKNPSFSINPNQYFGDYSTNLILLVLKSKNSIESMGEISKEILRTLKFDLPEDIFSEIKIEENGIINFFVSKKLLLDNFHHIAKEEKPFSNFKNDKRVHVVEFSSPNMVKPFSIGFTRSTIIGHAISNILEYSGLKIVKDNHLGDWGSQFGKLLYAIDEWSSFEEIEEQKNPYQTIIDIYLRFIRESKTKRSLIENAQEYYLRLENGDVELLKKWNLAKQILLTGLLSTYNRLEISFDNFSFESLFKEKANFLVQDLLNRGVLNKSNGAVLFLNNDNYPLILRKSDGTSLYAAREIACDISRKEKYGDDVVIINEVGGDQESYLSQIFELEFLINLFEKDQRIHLSHGMYKLNNLKITSDKSDNLCLVDILDQVKLEIKKQRINMSPENLEIIAQGNLRFLDLKTLHKKDIVFNIPKLSSLNEGTGFYVQKTILKSQRLSQKKWVFWNSILKMKP